MRPRIPLNRSLCALVVAGLVVHYGCNRLNLPAPREDLNQTTEAAGYSKDKMETPDDPDHQAATTSGGEPEVSKGTSGQETTRDPSTGNPSPLATRDTIETHSNGESSQSDQEESVVTPAPLQEDSADGAEGEAPEEVMESGGASDSTAGHEGAHILPQLTPQNWVVDRGLTESLSWPIVSESAALSGQWQWSLTLPSADEPCSDHADELSVDSNLSVVTFVPQADFRGECTIGVTASTSAGQVSTSVIVEVVRTWPTDVSPPSEPGNPLLGTIPTGVESSPALSWEPSVDDQAGVASYEARILEHVTAQAETNWLPLASGEALVGLQLDKFKRYRFEVRAIDQSGKVGSAAQR